MFEPIPLRSYFTLSCLTVALFSASCVVVPVSVGLLCGYLAAFALCVLVLLQFMIQIF